MPYHWILEWCDNCLRLAAPAATAAGHLRELLDLGRVQREVCEAVVFEEDGGLVRKALRGGKGRAGRRTGKVDRGRLRHEILFRRAKDK